MFYDYDEAGRLTRVYSAQDPDGVTKVTQAEYAYLANDQVRRLQLGVAQGVDYVYNERDWLKQINQQNLNPTEDPGGDGANGMPLDRFGMVLGYYEVSGGIGHIGEAQGAQAQYNGNISWLMYNTSPLTYTGTTGSTNLVGWSYNYDRANRLTKADFGYYTSTPNWSWKSTLAYDTAGMRYDANGNLEWMRRMGGGSSATPLNEFRYNYSSNSNRLASVWDTTKNAARGYTYDANGNMTSDDSSYVSGVQYDYRNLPLQATIRGNTVKYRYDSSGNRIYKESSAGKSYYIRGADGETLAVYDENDTLLFWNIIANGKMIGKLVP